MGEKNDLLEPIGWEKTPYGGWSDQALDAFIIMTNDQVSGSMFPRGREHYQKKLDSALRERELRRQRTQGRPEVEFHSETVMKEEVGRTYTHEVSGSSDPRSPQDDN